MGERCQFEGYEYYEEEEEFLARCNDKQVIRVFRTIRVLCGLCSLFPRLPLLFLQQHQPITRARAHTHIHIHTRAHIQREKILEDLKTNGDKIAGYVVCFWFFHYFLY